MNILKCLTIFLTSCLFSTSCYAEISFDGRWKGDLNLGQAKLTLVFNIQHTDAEQSATLDIREQNVKGLEVDKMNITDSTIRLSISAIGFTFKGTLTEETPIIKGEMHQNGYTFPLSLEPYAEVKRPQTPQAPFPYRQEEVAFYNHLDGNKFTGTLVTPLLMKANTPIAILVSGSGQQNRDEELMDHRPFLVIADYLARNGIATLRYDDRGIGGSEATNLLSSTTETFKTDAASAIKFLKDKGYLNIGIIGHSEGGLIAYMLGAESADLSFIISLAGTAVGGDSILLQQNRLILEKSNVPQATISSYCNLLSEIYTLKRTQTIDNREQIISMLKEKYCTLPDQLKANLPALLQSQPWLDYFITYDPTPTLQQIKCRTLALNGEKDVQVVATQNISAAQRHIPSELLTTKIYPNLNHLFQNCTTGMPIEYAQIEETISPEVLKDIVNWIRKN